MTSLELANSLAHRPPATLPGMWERTITVGSAGKTFSATGWKMGWGIGPEHLVKHMQTMHANTGYCYPTLLQEAVARALEVETARLGQPDCYFTQLAVDTERKRDEIAEVLREVGLEPIIPDSGYFMMADTTPLGIKFDSGNDEPYDFQFTKWMTREKGVATIPPSAFFSPANKHLVEKFVRFCFIKDDATLQAAYAKLREWAKELKSEKKT
ncbi:Kynurenine--oxoglutarate transaminase 3 [Geodia barretti]|uniref:kynurenine--oxoglutarate transaminase n=1 Tax=Geodia barretti TaxID=519541 RepID=A0AA35SU32_GEOBA|nr:Kynurenine--oxoglutarate transaminase 3 [Geodia barretti]